MFRGDVDNGGGGGGGGIINFSDVDKGGGGVIEYTDETLESMVVSDGVGDDDDEVHLTIIASSLLFLSISLLISCKTS